MRHTYPLAVVAIVAASLQLAGCGKQSSYTKVEPAHIEHAEGSQVIKLTLTEKAMERIDVKTAEVREAEVGQAENKQKRHVVPYSALMYVPDGQTFVYVSPKPRTFERQIVNVDFIEGDSAVLNEGPALGTLVVTVGAAELWGTETGIGGTPGH